MIEGLQPAQDQSHPGVGTETGAPVSTMPIETPPPVGSMGESLAPEAPPTLGIQSLRKPPTKRTGIESSSGQSPREGIHNTLKVSARTGKSIEVRLTGD